MLLSLLLLIPFLGALALILWPGSPSSARLRDVSIVLLVVQCLASFALLLPFDAADAGLQLVEQARWVHAIGLDYALALDGLSLPLVLMNGVLCLVAAIASRTIENRPRVYFALLLVISGAVNGAFLAQNLLLFFLFYELELIPLWMLIAVWGGANRAYAATKFLIVTAVSGVLILGAFLGIALVTGTMDFSLRPILSGELGMTAQLLLMGALLIGFGIKIPLFPFHTWLPDAHTEASTPVSVLLAGVLLKLGTYGLLRFCLGLFPDAWQVAAPWLAGWAAISVLYGSLAAIAQTDMKRMVAYSSVGHMGYVLLAAAAATPLGLMGALFQMVSHGLISGVLFLVVGVVYAQTGTRDLNVLRGLLNPQRGLPLTGSLMIIGGYGQCRNSRHGGFHFRIPDFPRQPSALPPGHAAFHGGIGTDGGVFPAVGESRLLRSPGDRPRRGGESPYPQPRGAAGAGPGHRPQPRCAGAWPCSGAAVEPQ